MRATGKGRHVTKSPPQPTRLQEISSAPACLKSASRRPTQPWNGIIRADARQLPIAAESAQCVVTSPPYWGLRDYGQDGQIGLERTPEEYVETMRGVFREVWRVLKPDGVCWLNLGDSYAGARRGPEEDLSTLSGTRKNQEASRAGQRAMTVSRRRDDHPIPRSDGAVAGLKSKDLVGMPWRVAFALQADGWYLRSDIIWAKSNPMPESVTDRPTKAHEYLFLLTKQGRYFYDAGAIKESVTGNAHARGNGVNPKAAKIPAGWNSGPGGHDTISGRYRPKQNASFSAAVAGLVDSRNKRSVWSIPTQPYPEAHYATFPEEIPETCIRAGSRAGDIVLDPFFGSGTVGRVAERLGRRWIGCDLGYQDLQKKRLTGVQRELPITDPGTPKEFHQGRLRMAERAIEGEA